MGSWLNRSDVEVKVELATSGELIRNGIPTQYPFVAGGTAGAPVGYWYNLGGQIVPPTTSDRITISTDSTLNRFSHSLPAGAPVNTTDYWPWAVFLPATPGHTYIVYVSAQTMDGKSGGRLTFSTELAKDNVLVSTGVTATSDTHNSVAGWEDMAANVNGGNPLPSTVNQIRVTLVFRGAYPTASANWGVQFSSLYVMDTDPNVPPISWVDVTCDLKSLGWRYGRERYTNRYEVGNGQLVLNNDSGDYTYSANQPLNLRPGRRIRVTARLGATWYPLFYGLIDVITEGYTLAGHAITTFTILDPTTLMSNIPTPKLGSSLQDERSDYRVNQLLDIAGYQSRSVDSSGAWLMQPIFASSRSIREEIGVTGDSEGGAFFAERDGSVVYKNRTWATTDQNLKWVTADILGTGQFGETNLPALDSIPTSPTAPAICTQQLNTDWSRARVMNHLELAYVGGSINTYDNLDSQRQNGVLTYSRSDYLISAGGDNLYHYRDTRAQDLMTGYAQPVLRVNSVGFKLNDVTQVADFQWGLTAFLNWMIRVWYSHPTKYWGFAVVTHIQSVEHKITIDDWEITLAVDLMESFVDWQLDWSEINGWDAGSWDINLWDQGDEPAGALFDSGYNWSNPTTSKWGM